MQMRGDVAIGGNFGFELDLSRQTPEDIETARALIKQVKAVRTLTRTGDFSRLVSPFGSNTAAWQFADEDKTELLVCFYQVLSLPMGATPFRVKLDCDETAVYADEASKRYSGGMLKHIGLPIPTHFGDFSSTVLHLKKI